MLILLVSSLLGFGFLGILPKSINGTLKFLICPALGLILFGELNILYAFLLGVSQSSIILSLLSQAVLSFFLAVKYRPSLKFERVSTVFAISFFTIVLFSTYTFLTQVLSQSGGNLYTGAGGLYGDTALHLAYTGRIQSGEFPPQNPLFAGNVLVYPYANDLLSAVFRIFGLAINYSFILPQIIFLTGFLALFYVFVRKFTNNLGFLLSLPMFFLGWGVGFFYFLRDYFANNPSFAVTEYTNNPDLNLHLHNIFTGLMLPERSFLPGIFLALFAFVNFWEFFNTKNFKFLVLNSLILGILPFWHTHTFIFVLISSAVFGLYYLIQNYKEEELWHFLTLPLISFVLVLPFIYLFLKNHNAESFIKPSFGWQDSGIEFVTFWFKNSFLVLPLAVMGFFSLKKDHRIYFVGPFIAFLVANVIIFQPWSWDNIKLISLSFLFFSILGGIYLATIFSNNFLLRVLVVFLVFISSLSGILSLKLQLSKKFVIYDKNDIELAAWAKKNTLPSDVFLIDPVPNHPIPGLSGRVVYLGYPGHLWVHGIDYLKREALNKSVIGGNLEKVEQTEVPISYVVFAKNTVVLDTTSYLAVFENNKYIVYRHEI